MKQRNFPHFLDAYMEYAVDNFVPDKFHRWSCLSIVAAALERRVWLPWSPTVNYYANIYPMLIAKPGIGKSTGILRAADLLKSAVAGQRTTINFLPSQTTEAKFIQLMEGYSRSFNVGTKFYTQCAGYLVASEGSNSLKSVYGDIVPCLTEMYDCPDHWSRGTMVQGTKTLEQVCLNIIAGCTFDYIKELVTAKNIMGGFASRLIYVVDEGQKARQQRFQEGLGKSDDEIKHKQLFKMKLIEDLRQMLDLSGPYSASPEYGAAWEAWKTKFDEQLEATKSEKLRSLLVRSNTTMFKVSMLMATCRGNGNFMELEDWERALAIMQPVFDGLPDLLRESSESEPNKFQPAAALSIINLMHKTREITEREVYMRLSVRGQNKFIVDQAIQSLVAGGAMKKVASSEGIVLRLLADPNDYL